MSVLGLNKRLVASHRCVHMSGSLLELQSMNFAAPQEFPDVSRNTWFDRESQDQKSGSPDLALYAWIILRRCYIEYQFCPIS